MPQLKLLYDAGLRLETTKDGLMISTPIRDWKGNLVASIDHNHWTIYPQYCLDKNYTRDSLEILDSRGHVVFQIQFMFDGPHIQGEWSDDTGHGVQILKSPDSTKLGALFVPEDRARGISSTFLIERIFVYPSKGHWREFVKPR